MKVVLVKHIGPVQTSSQYDHTRASWFKVYHDFRRVEQVIPKESAFATDKANLQRAWHARDGNTNGFVRAAALHAHTRGWHTLVCYGEPDKLVGNMTFLSRAVENLQETSHAVSLIFPIVNSSREERRVLDAFIGHNPKAILTAFSMYSIEQSAPYFELAVHVD